MDNPLVSVVIPVYNTESYIDSCIRSIISQSYSKLEIIIVDDGSTDGSLSIIGQIASADDRIRVIQKANEGVNLARREGVNHSSGEWVVFVDSDDSLPFDSIATLLEASSVDCDIVVGYSFMDSNPIRQICAEQWRSELIKSNPILCTPWGKLYRRSLFDERVFYIESNGRLLGEDMLMNIKIAFQSNKSVIIIPNKVYNYTLRDNGLSKSSKWTFEMIADLYVEVLNSIPVNERVSYLSDLVENRIKALRSFALSGNRASKGHISNSSFIKGLYKDISTSQFVLSLSDKLVVKYPDSIIVSGCFKVSRILLICYQYIRRVLH